MDFESCISKSEVRDTRFRACSRLARIQNWVYLFGAILFEKDAE
jgi:hypothetical protein